MKPKRVISRKHPSREKDAEKRANKVESLRKTRKPRTKRSGSKNTSSETRKRKDRKNELISKVKRRILKIDVRKRKNKDFGTSRISFERSPGPSPASAIIPP